MDLQRYVATLQEALGASAATSTDEVREAAARLAHSLEPAVRLALIEIAADVAAEATLGLDGDVVDIRVRGGRPEIVVVPGPRSGPATSEFAGTGLPPLPPLPPTPPSRPTEEGEPGEDGTARISLRLPESLKDRVDRAAAADGISVNAWLVRTAQHALRPAEQPTDNNSRSGRRMTGWAR